MKDYSKNKIIQVLMKRDELTLEEAIEVFNDVKEEMEEAIAAGDYELAEEIMASELGLELDYVFDILLMSQYDG